MNSFLAALLFFFSFELIANEAITTIRTHPAFDGTVISYCTLNNKVCGKIDRTKPNFLLTQVLERFPEAAKVLDELQPNFESFKVKYKIADLPNQESNFKYSYERPKKSK